MADPIEESDLERGARVRDELARAQLLEYASPTIVPDEQAKPAPAPVAETPPKEA